MAVQHVARGPQQYMQFVSINDMSKIIETTINRFDGGITNDPRNPAENVARMMSNFDVLTSPNKMTPYRSSESGDDAGSTSIKRNFAIALRTGTTYSLYALGVVSGQNYVEVLYKNLTTGATTDLDDNAWAATANNADSSGATDFNLFVFYRRTGLIYGSSAGSRIWAYDPSGVASFAATSRSLTYTQIGQGLVHSKDDILYIPYYNNAGAAGAKSFIARNNNTTWTDAALTLPDHLIPTSISEYGNFIAVVCTPASGIGNSRLYLWNRDSSLATLSETIDCGTGSAIICEEIDGELVIISQKGGAATSFTGNPHGSSSHRDRVIFRILVNNQALKFLEIQANHSGGANTTILPLYKQKVDNRLFFQMLIELNGSVRDGVWSIGRSAPGARFALIHERTSNNNTALTTSDSLRGFIMVGDYLFQSYVAGGTHATTKTDDSSTGFSHNSVYETKTFNGGDSTIYKDLTEAMVETEYMPTAGQITLAYQINENVGTSTWTTIFTNTTNNSVSHTANNIESSGATLPKQYKQIAFRILSTGGAEVTGLRFKEELTVRKHIVD